MHLTFGDMKTLPLLLALIALGLTPYRLPALGHHQSGIAGYTAYGIICDVSGCVPNFTSMRLLIYSDRDRLVADVTSDSDGLFEVALKPGSYFLAPYFVPATPDAELVPVGQPFPVLVEKKEYTTIGINYVSIPGRPPRPPSPPYPPFPPLPIPGR